MYQAHFGLQELPFGLTPDTSYAYTCASYQAALNTLLIAVGNGEGFIKITGEVGTGKTLLCRTFLAALDTSYTSAYIPNPSLEPRALLLALADDLKLRPKNVQLDQYQIIRGLTHVLLGYAAAGRRVVLCLDEAQAIPIKTFEALRLLTNLETEKRKLLQVVLFGQPELDAKLAHESVRQLRQRITFQYELEPLQPHELEYYLDHRLRVAGWQGPRLFGPAAVRALHHASRGIPRLVNIVGHKAMLLLYGEGGQQVYARHVRAAASDTPAARQSWWGVWRHPPFMVSAFDMRR